MGTSINPNGRLLAEADIEVLERAAGVAGRFATWDQGPKFLDIEGQTRLISAYQSLLVELGQMAPTIAKLTKTREAQSRSGDRKRRVA